MAGTDYTAGPLKLTFTSANQSPQTVTVNATSDSLLEGGETFFIRLSVNDSAVKVGSGEAFIIIFDITSECDIAKMSHTINLIHVFSPTISNSQLCRV